MQYFSEQGSSHREVLQQIREKYGEQAKVMNHRNIRFGGFLGMFQKEGVEVSGYISNEQPLRRRAELTEEKNRLIAAAASATARAATVTESKEKVSDTPNTPVEEKISSADLSLVMTELREIKEKVNSEGGESADHPSIEKIESLLEKNDFSLKYIKNIISKLKKELSLEELDDYEGVQSRVVDWIGDSITLYKEPQHSGRRMILIGPTGVGKTTTIAKLAAMYGLDNDGGEAMKVRMITIDNYRIGARGQLETYGDIMNIPVASVEDYQEMKKKLALFEDAKMILVDTTGRNPKDYQNIAAMRELLDACGSSSEFYLAVSATTKASDIREICQEFEPFKYQAVVLTKLDETLRVGNIISVLSEQRKPLAFITDGQGVPLDIEKASKGRLLRNLDGFKINRQELDELDARSVI